MKKIILLVFLIFLIILFVVVIFILNTKNNKVKTSPTPTPFKNQLQDTALPGARNDPQNEEENRRSFLVGSLINILPYHGRNFSFYYNFSTNQFILYINPAAVSQGNTEFDAFLKQNHVEARSWIENLTTTQDNTTPAP